MVLNTKRTYSNGQDTVGKCVRFPSLGFPTCAALIAQVYMSLRQEHCCWYPVKDVTFQICTLSFMKSNINKI